MILETLTTIICSKHPEVNHEWLSKYFELVLNYPEIDTYTEGHHILPKSLFPQYRKSKWNIVNLTGRDHLYAHYYLYKALVNEPNMTFALWGMCNQKNKNHDRSDIDLRIDEIAKIYEESRMAHAKLFTERQLANNTMKGRTGINSPYFGVKRPKHVVEKMKANHWSKWRKPWNHNKANIGAWLMAEQAYTVWLELGQPKSSGNVEKKLQVTCQYFKTIVNHFKKGWDPGTDNDFQAWIQSTHP